MIPIPSNVPWKLIGLGVGLVAVLAFVLLAFHWKGQAADRKEQLAAICVATRTAANQPKLDCRQVPQQIQFMGQAIGTLTQALHKQNDAVAAMGAASAKAQAEADKAVLKAATRARASEATAERLERSSRSTAAPSASQRQCEPSKAVQEAWR